MKISALSHPRQIAPLLFSGSDVPHATIETNRTCNIRCEHCYNRDKSHVKPFAEIVDEIDELARRRKLQTLTIMGGEPTLHPDLLPVVSYIKSKKLKCQVLTNAAVFTRPSGDAMLDALQIAGIDRIAVHLDRGQRHVYGDIEQTRRLVFDKLESRKIRFSLSITIDDNERASVPGVVKTYARYRYFDGIVGFMAGGNPEHKQPGLHLEEEYKALSRELGVEPAAFVPSNLDAKEIRWLLYYLLVDSRTGAAVAVPSIVNQLFCGAYAFLTGRLPFYASLHPAFAGITGLMISLVQVVFSPKKALKILGRMPFRGIFSSVRLQYIAFQVPPEFDASTKVIEMCRFCPDATMRNGNLMPLCLADFISPLGAGKESPATVDEKYAAVIRSLSGGRLSR